MTVTSPHGRANETLQEATAQGPIDALIEGMNQVIFGKQDVVRDFLTAVLAGGSVLMEDLPGVGKTTLVKTFASLVDLTSNRLQCTPDLMPADVLGFSVYSSANGTLEFRPGPVFANLLLVDEINRASPRTQSALLEAMAERQVTIEGTTRELPQPFWVIATQNPIGFQGTYPLPEAQLDRFLFLLSMDYPDTESEIELLYAQNNERDLLPIISVDEIVQWQSEVQRVDVHRDMAAYIVRLVDATRTHPRLRIGCSPRGSQMLFRASQAAAFVSGRKYVLPDDVQRVAPLVLTHRIVLNRSAQGAMPDKKQVVREVIESVAVPV